VPMVFFPEIMEALFIALKKNTASDGMLPDD
jgi:hypothetical protein